MAYLGGKDGNGFCLIGALLKRNTFAQLGEYWPSDYITYEFFKKMLNLYCKNTYVAFKMEAFSSI